MLRNTEEAKKKLYTSGTENGELKAFVHPSTPAILTQRAAPKNSPQKRAENLDRKAIALLGTISKRWVRLKMTPVASEKKHLKRTST